MIFVIILSFIIGIIVGRLFFLLSNKVTIDDLTIGHSYLMKDAIFLNGSKGYKYYYKGKFYDELTDIKEYGT